MYIYYPWIAVVLTTQSGGIAGVFMIRSMATGAVVLSSNSCVGG